jgi:hypothetical protein
MKQKELELPGLKELCEREKMEFRGGSLFTPIWWSIAASFVSNFGDVRDGFSDGYGIKPPRY